MSSEITSVQFGVLDWLAARPGLGQRDLCELLDLDRSTIADVVARLVRRGLVTRVRDEEDRRRNVLTLTEVGSSELAALLAKIDEVDKRLTSQLDAADVETLRKLLLTVVESPDVRASVDSQSD